MIIIVELALQLVTKKLLKGPKPNNSPRTKAKKLANQNH
jgi:hypothetical protein